MNTSIDDLLGGGAAGKSMKFDNIGDGYSGIVVSSEPRPYTDIQTGKPQFWDDGGAKMQAVIGVQTDERDPSIENDDGVRYAYIKMWGKQKQAFRVAAQAAGGSPAPGDRFSVRFIGTEPSKTRGFNDTKLYEYSIVKANPLDAALAGGPQEAPAPQFQQQPVQQFQQQPVQQVAQQPVQQFQQQPVQQFQQPVQQVAQQPVQQQPVQQQPAATDPQLEERIRTLIGKSLEDEAIAAVIDGATPDTIAQVRLRMAAGASNGF